MSSVYSVTLGSNTRLNIIDVVSGRILNNIQITGTLINGPIVVGNKCTIVTDSNGIRKGYVHDLPTGRLSQTYQV